LNQAANWRLEIIATPISSMLERRDLRGDHGPLRLAQMTAAKFIELAHFQAGRAA